MDTKVCKLCHVGLLKQHPELFWWTKCEICGYSEFRQEDYDRRREDQTGSDKLAKLI